LVDAEPVIRIEDRSGEKVTYANVNADAARKIVAEHLQKGKVVDGLAVGKTKEAERTK
jgi:(2Fe-2S) ferredoxin